MGNGTCTERSKSDMNEFHKTNRVKLAYSTLGCPEWDLAQMIARTREYGFDGVDFRGYRDALDITTTPEFSSRARETAQRFADAGIAVPCLSTGIGVNGADD